MEDGRPRPSGAAPQLPIREFDPPPHVGASVPARVNEARARPGSTCSAGQRPGGLGLLPAFWRTRMSAPQVHARHASSQPPPAATRNAAAPGRKLFFTRVECERKPMGGSCGRRQSSTEWTGHDICCPARKALPARRERPRSPSSDRSANRSWIPCHGDSEKRPPAVVLDHRHFMTR